MGAYPVECNEPDDSEEKEITGVSPVSFGGALEDTVRADKARNPNNDDGDIDTDHGRNPFLRME